MSDTPKAWEGTSQDPAFWAAIGRAIKVERTARGWERKDLAERSGLSYPYLSEIETGRKRPGYKALVAIAGALEVPLSGLLQAAESTADEQAGESAAAFDAPSAQALRVQRPVGGSWWTQPGRSMSDSFDHITGLLPTLSLMDLRLVADLVDRLAQRSDR